MKFTTYMALVAILAISLITFDACKTASTVPGAPNPTPTQTTKYSNQLNPMDATAYTSLMAAQTALNSFKPIVATQYHQYIPQYNATVASYNTSIAAYKLFRTNPADSTALANTLVQLTTNVANLESAFQTAMGSQPQFAHSRATMKAAAFRPDISFSTILTELQLGASVASAIPVASPYALLAQSIITITQGIYNDYQQAHSINVDNLKDIAPLAIA